MDRIVGTALELVDEEGAEALSMRSLAQRLGSGTATLYRHFANRAELVAMVVDRMLGEVAIASEPVLSWDEACISFAHNMFEALGRHSNAARLLAGHIPMGPNAMAQREFVLNVLLNGGFSAEAAARTYATLSRFILGFAMQVSASEVTEPNDESATVMFGRLDADSYPATVAVAGHLPVPLADEFDFGLRLIVDGLARLA
ncbi:TetR family transcriptional regulator [Mycobacterium gordonae]|uniref:TetR family transcriptional regulator n=1 Tax=Mycobacterium gordonae TaxID=1778 RepID=A0A0Q2QNE7_MYCGO|nr:MULTISPECIES: TetR/AcrR family transcriptional regulator [Mycobacterium]KQH81389.1 TetR family transcriptional regulator [Mycobacterium gordonae]MDP7730979.1 TetR/AcrR family transcriptional regulator [Mycobacterium sp. TY813]